MFVKKEKGRSFSQIIFSKCPTYEKFTEEVARKLKIKKAEIDEILNEEQVKIDEENIHFLTNRQKLVAYLHSL